ncbi:MAG: ATP-binding protein [Patescibacteria group bacterium]
MGVFRGLARQLLGVMRLSFSGQETRHRFALRVLEHAIASPLTVLKSSLSVIQTHGSTDRRALVHAQKAIEYLELLIAELLHTKKSTFDCLSALQQVVVLSHSRGLEVKVVLDARIKGKQHLLSGSKVRFQEAIHCIINNAAQSYDCQSATLIIITVMPFDEGIKILIADFGCGMNFWQQRLATIPLLTLRNNGSGIGLSFARSIIIDELDGNLMILSYKNIGTTIQITLPITLPTSLAH